MASPVWLRLLIAVCALQTFAVDAVADAPEPTGDTASLVHPLVTQAFGTQSLPLPSLHEPPTWELELPQQFSSLLNRATGDSEACSTLLYLRVSRDYLSQRFEKEVNRTKPVTDLILGTRIRGESLTRGKTRLVLIPNDDKLVAEIEFVGTVDSQTRGTNGPAILHYKSESTFRATKQIMIDADGLTVAPARARAETKLRPLRIESRVGGLVGVVVEQVARRRVAESQQQANAIASDHMADIVAGDLDRGLEKSVGVLTAVLAEAAGLKPSELIQLATSGAGAQLHLKLRTTRDYAELVLASEDATWKELASVLPRANGSPHVTLRVHRSVLTSTGTDSSGSPALAKLLANGMKTQLAKRTAALVESPPISDEHPIEWSVGLNWLCVDVGRIETSIETKIGAKNEAVFRSAQLEPEPPRPSIDGAQ